MSWGKRHTLWVHSWSARYEVMHPCIRTLPSLVLELSLPCAQLCLASLLRLEPALFSRIGSVAVKPVPMEEEAGGSANEENSRL